MFKVNNKDARKTPTIVNFKKVNVGSVMWKSKECVNNSSLMHHGNGTSGSRNREELKIDPSVLLYNVQTSFVLMTKKFQSTFVLISENIF